MGLGRASFPSCLHSQPPADLVTGPPSSRHPGSQKPPRLHVGWADEALFLGEKHLLALPSNSGGLVRLPSGLFSSSWALSSLRGPQLASGTPVFLAGASPFSAILPEVETRSSSLPRQSWATLPSFLILRFPWGPCSLPPEHWLASLLPAFPSSSLRYTLLALLEHRSDFVSPWRRGSQGPLVDHGIADSATWQLPSPPP